MAVKENIDDDYVKAGFGGGLDYGDTPALLMIDFCKAYIDKDCSLYAGVESSAEAAKTLLASARDAGILVIHTRVEFNPNGLDGGVFYRKVPALKNLNAGSPFGVFVEGLEPAENEVVITKRYASGFFGTDMASTLAAHKVDTCLIAGWSTSGCVRATALDSCQSGFVPIVVKDAVGDRDDRIHDSNLFDLQAKYAEVRDMAEVLDYLEKVNA